MTLEVVLITGMSGSGKSVALHALEDAGYYCVDNLPPELLLPFVELEQHPRGRKVAIAMDVRSAASLPLVPEQLADLRKRGISVRSLFLDAMTETLVHRYSETRRRHPLSRSDDAVDSHERRRARASPRGCAAQRARERGRARPDAEPRGPRSPA